MVKYSKEVASKVCEYIAEGYTLRSIEKQEGMPHKSTVMDWCAKHPEFAEQYARAKEIQAEAFAEELLEIVDDASNDWMERQGEEGQTIGWVLNGEHVQRSRLRVDTRKWLMSKMLPKKYGDKQQHEHAGKDGAAMIGLAVAEITITDEDDLDARLAAVERAIAGANSSKKTKTPTPK